MLITEADARASVAADSVPPPHRTRPRRSHNNTLAGYAFVSPLILGLLLWTMIPLGVSLFYSFTKYNLPDKPQWVGLQNYHDLLVSPAFHNAIVVTVIYAVVQVPLGLVVGLMIAVLLNQNIAGMRLFRTLIYLPAVLPPVGSVIVFKDLMSPSEYGVVNSVLLRLHLIDKPLQFLASPSTALLSLVVIGMWGAGGSMLVWLAALQSVPTDVQEAARVDGAGPVTRFFRITLPLVSPAILFNLVLGLIGAMQIFTQAVVVSGAASGAPLGSLDFLNVFIYRQAYTDFRMGYASAAAWLLFLMTLAVTLVFFRWSRRWVFYAGDQSG